MKWDTENFLIVFCIALLFLLCVHHAPAQEYTVTETQLQQLETILQNYKTDRQKALSKVSSLQASLEKERQTTMSLSESLTTYEQQVNEIAEQKDLLQDQNNKLLLKNKNKIIAIIILSIVIFILILSAVVYVLIKLKIL